ncbi:MAG: hypothetical protein ABSB30_10325 [Terracidiphilus sp.]|jgi:hypothetical protein
MKRPVGVVFSAIVLILGSLFQLLMALGMAFSGAISQKQIHSGGFPGATAAAPLPGWMPVFMYAICVFFVALSVWGIATSVGLIRMRRWARYSILVIGGLLAVFSFIEFVITLLMMLVPLPVPADVDASQVQTVHAMTRIIFAVMAFFHGVVCAVGVSWLVYFNRQKVRDAFANATGKACESRRPVLISVLAVLNLIGAGFCLMFMFIPLPAVIFGWMIDGWGKVALYLAFAALAAAVGVGLWQLKEWGRLLAMAMQVFGIIFCGVYLVRPSLMLRYVAEIQQRMTPTQPQLPQPFQATMYSVMFGFSILFYIAIVAVLLYYRKAFQPPAEISQNESGLPM